MITQTKLDQYKIFAGMLIGQLSLLYFIVSASAWMWIPTIFFYFLMMGLGVSLLNHRMLAHRSVAMENKLLKYFLLFWSTVMLQGSTLAWVGMHREHHGFSDTEKDPHSPVFGFWKSYFLSMFHTPNFRFVKDIMRDTDIQLFHKNYWEINFLYGILLYSVFGINGLLIGYLVPAALTWHGVSIVNSISHYPSNYPWILGYRNFDTAEYSKNIPLAGYLTWGEAWHNNHHGNAANPSFKSKWWEWDLIGQIGQLINKANNKMDS